MLRCPTLWRLFKKAARLRKKFKVIWAYVCMYRESILWRNHLDFGLASWSYQLILQNSSIQLDFYLRILRNGPYHLERLVVINLSRLDKNGSIYENWNDKIRRSLIQIDKYEKTGIACSMILSNYSDLIYVYRLMGGLMSGCKINCMNFLRHCASKNINTCVSLMFAIHCETQSIPRMLSFTCVIIQTSIYC